LVDFVIGKQFADHGLEAGNVVGHDDQMAAGWGGRHVWFEARF
jgi:hypothetical protein